VFARQYIKVLLYPLLFNVFAEMVTRQAPNGVKADYVAKELTICSELMIVLIATTLPHTTSS